MLYEGRTAPIPPEPINPQAPHSINLNDNYPATAAAAAPQVHKPSETLYPAGCKPADSQATPHPPPDPPAPLHHHHPVALSAAAATQSPS
ncbi:uncharacterized protein BO95DRAFT_202115 [Aspergillus brunneoviolaceus CBS 621.78]|uniref:Uncharacterized protein n=1 Tax=Aspergillus brunneoviolaceus CBS 621.78 TaxID=1450534 RepID=A0ACD1G365_9EURO|nr:hypothetical protein BO95DRAFT_202115 [Aspergillus brunneoviolaceus CBS 621.78]RAH43706.1 hypothetical protein BO95DRAFT_202115 [Aspergillus brunneoviolaceus CBS 621.78]